MIVLPPFYGSLHFWFKRETCDVLHQYFMLLNSYINGKLWSPYFFSLIFPWVSSTRYIIVATSTLTPLHPSPCDLKFRDYESSKTFNFDLIDASHFILNIVHSPCTLSSILYTSLALNPQISVLQYQKKKLLKNIIFFNSFMTYAYPKSV